MDAVLLLVILYRNAVNMVHTMINTEEYVRISTVSLITTVLMDAVLLQVILKNNAVQTVHTMMILEECVMECKNQKCIAKPHQHPHKLLVEIMKVFRVAHIVVKTGMQSSQMGGMAQNVFLLYPVWDVTIHLVILLHVSTDRNWVGYWLSLFN